MIKEEFLVGVDNWSNHRYLLWPALEATKHLKLPVLELGCGKGSTPFLKQYCKDEGLELFSYDYSEEYAKEFDAVYVTNWDNIPWRKGWGVVLIDESPGSHRVESLQRLQFSAQIIVIHDSEPAGWNASDYRVREWFFKFRWTKDLQSKEPQGAWATILSNFVDVSEF